MSKKETEKFYKTKMMEEVDKIPLPKDFGKFLDKTVFNSHAMFISRIGQKKYLGDCQYCKSKGITLFNVEAKDKIKCPCCDHVVTLKNARYSTFENLEFCWLIQKCSTGYVQRLFKVYRKSFGVEYNFTYNEVERCFFSFNPNEHRWFHITNSGDWYNNRYSNMFYEYPYLNYTYTKNLKMLNKIEGFEYCPFTEYCKMFGGYTNILLLLDTYVNYPVIEKFVKCKLSKLSNYLLKDYDSKPLAFDYSANDLKSILRLKRNSTLKYVLKNNSDWEELKSLRILDHENLEINNENLMTAHYVDLLNKDAYSYLGFDGVKSYFIKSDEEDLYSRIQDYNDYFKNCVKLKRDMRDTKWLKPYDFTTAHDQAYKLVQSMESKQLDSKVKRVLKKYFKLEYSDNEYCVVFPKSAQDIRLEGKNNANCVGGYVKRVAEGRSLICFIRHTKEPDKSFYTLEVDPSTFEIVQCRGYHNNKTKEEKQVQAFARTWKTLVLDKFAKKIV